MTQHIDPCETARVRVLAAALVLQQCTKTAANIVPIPGREPKRFIAIGTKAEVARLLELAPATVNATPENLDPDPIEQLVDTIDLGAQPEQHGADLADSEGGHHD